MPEQRIDWKILARRLHERIGVCGALYRSSKVFDTIHGDYETCRNRIGHEQDAKELLRPDDA